MVTPGLHRRPHPHGRPGVLGPAGRELVLARRHHRGDGQLRVHARAGARRRPGAGGAQPRAGRGHRPRGAGVARVELGDLPRVPRRGRPAPEGDQLRGQRRPLGAAHVGDGRARLRGGGDRRRPRADEGRSSPTRCAAGRDRAHDVAQRAPRDVRRPSGGVAARGVGGGVRAGRGDGRRRARASSKAAASTCSRPIPSSASWRATRMRDARRRRPASHDDGHHRHQPRWLRDARPHRQRRRGRRAHDRPVALPRHQRAALVRAPGCRSTCCRSGTTCARCPTTSSCARCAIPAVRERLDPRRHGGRLLAVAGDRGMPRKPDFDGIRVYEHGLPPNPTINEVAAQRGASRRSRR